VVSKKFDWENGVVLEDHTKKKHDVVREYFRQYLITRCQLPQQERFRLAVIDGFSGGGLYRCGNLGSPLIFLDVLKNTTNEINISRSSQGLRPIQIECLLILNDASPSAIKLLRENIAPHLAEAKDKSQYLHVAVEYSVGNFEKVYPSIRTRLKSGRCGNNVFFNLDQGGYSQVTVKIIQDIVNVWKSAEVILTFMIGSLLAYLSPNRDSSGVPLDPEIHSKIYALLEDDNVILEKKEWLGEAEQIVYSHLKGCAAYITPFSINNPNGWRYWLMHFANAHHARRVFNNVLHADNSTQAHFGRAGLHMLSYDPKKAEGQLYLFDGNSRESAKIALYEDIPRLVAECGDAIAVQEFYAIAYSETPAHSEDIHDVIIQNPDLQVVTGSGGERRKPNTIRASDTLKLKSQRSLIFMFSGSREE
jgi:three-Cys-motif partner protein